MYRWRRRRVTYRRHRTPVLCLALCLLSQPGHTSARTMYCPPGSYVKGTNPNTGYLECIPCPHGQFQDQFTVSAKSCAPCSQGCIDTRRMDVVSECSTVHDLVCECPEGLYAPRPDALCEYHSQCPPKYGVVNIGTKTADTQCQQCAKGFESPFWSQKDPCVPTPSTTALVISAVSTSLNSWITGANTASTTKTLGNDWRSLPSGFSLLSVPGLLLVIGLMGILLLLAIMVIVLGICYIRKNNYANVHRHEGSPLAPTEQPSSVHGSVGEEIDSPSICSSCALPGPSTSYHQGNSPCNTQNGFAGHHPLLSGFSPSDESQLLTSDSQDISTGPDLGIGWLDVEQRDFAIPKDTHTPKVKALMDTWTEYKDFDLRENPPIDNARDGKVVDTNSQAHPQSEEDASSQTLMFDSDLAQLDNGHDGQTERKCPPSPSIQSSTSTTGTVPSQPPGFDLENPNYSL